MDADTNYSDRPWMRNTPDAVQLKRPNASYEDAMTAQALSASMGEPVEAIRAIRPPLQITPFPPRFGYRTDALGIADIVTLDDLYVRRDFSGRQSGYSGSSMPSLNQY